MPLLRYTEYKPKPEARLIIDRANQILEEYSAQGYELTLRQTYYQFVARDLFPDSWADPQSGTKNTQKNYKKLGDIISRAREAGMIDWNHITDRTRSVTRSPFWRSPKDFLLSVAPQFSLDLWADQDERVIVYVEKDALADVVSRATTQYGVPYFANKGYLSASAAWYAAQHYFKRWHVQYGQPTTILHLGDHDPSGINMTEDVLSRASMFARPTAAEREKTGYPSVSIRRLALNMDQVRQYNPPPNPAKEEDPRFGRYQERFGDESWELDALEPAVIVDIITDAIEEHVDMSRLQHRKQLVTEAVEQLQHIAEQFDTVVERLGHNPLDCVVPDRPPPGVPSASKGKARED